MSSISLKLLHFSLSQALPPGDMSETLVPLLELPSTKKTPPVRLPSKADFLCLLYGCVGGTGNFVGFQGKIYFGYVLHLILISISQELEVSVARL